MHGDALLLLPPTALRIPLLPSFQQGAIELSMSPTYHKQCRERRLRSSRAGVQKREENRRERTKDCEDWKRVGTFLLVVHAAPDGRNVASQAHNCATWYRCGSERAVRGALARMLWNPPPPCGLPVTCP